MIAITTSSSTSVKPFFITSPAGSSLSSAASLVYHRLHEHPRQEKCKLAGGYFFCVSGGRPGGPARPVRPAGRGGRFRADNHPAAGGRVRSRNHHSQDLLHPRGEHRRLRLVRQQALRAQERPGAGPGPSIPSPAGDGLAPLRGAAGRRAPRHGRQTAGRGLCLQRGSTPKGPGRRRHHLELRRGRNYLRGGFCVVCLPQRQPALPPAIHPPARMHPPLSAVPDRPDDGVARVVLRGAGRFAGQPRLRPRRPPPDRPRAGQAHDRRLFRPGLARARPAPQELPTARPRPPGGPRAPVPHGPFPPRRPVPQADVPHLARHAPGDARRGRPHRAGTRTAGRVAGRLGQAQLRLRRLPRPAQHLPLRRMGLGAGRRHYVVVRFRRRRETLPYRCVSVPGRAGRLPPPADGLPDAGRPAACRG
ncbi:MAG: hypothetical protein BWX88_01231 [Planctomycetes bacterium ADurb.Bin126]|nr:MAG: hypothetical protein BWX88_01231 [Planctomycetes bacterium ADurb.Bin126]